MLEPIDHVPSQYIIKEINMRYCIVSKELNICRHFCKVVNKDEDDEENYSIIMTNTDAGESDNNEEMKEYQGTAIYRYYYEKNLEIPSHFDKYSFVIDYDMMRTNKTEDIKKIVIDFGTSNEYFHFALNNCNDENIKLFIDERIKSKLLESTFYLLSNYSKFECVKYIMENYKEDITQTMIRNTLNALVNRSNGKDCKTDIFKYLFDFYNEEISRDLNINIALYGNDLKLKEWLYLEKKHLFPKEVIMKVFRYNDYKFFVKNNLISLDKRHRFYKRYIEEEE
jgi:hypothetical protein